MVVCLLGKQARNEHGAVHKRIQAAVEIGGVSRAWQRLWILQVLQTYCRHIAGIADILQTYCRHIADILRTYCRLWWEVSRGCLVTAHIHKGNLMPLRSVTK